MFRTKQFIFREAISFVNDHDLPKMDQRARNMKAEHHKIMVKSVISWTEYCTIHLLHRIWKALKQIIFEWNKTCVNIYGHTHTQKNTRVYIYNHSALSLKVDGIKNVIGFELSKFFIMVNVLHLLFFRLFYTLTTQKYLQQKVVKLWLYFRAYWKSSSILRKIRLQDIKYNLE